MGYGIGCSNEVCDNHTGLALVVIGEGGDGCCREEVLVHWSQSAMRTEGCDENKTMVQR